MGEQQSKPTLVYFQYKYDERLTAFLLEHTREHVRCLSQYFEVQVINEDCDYREVCDKFQPDLVLFESGVPFPTCRRPKVTSLNAYPKVPKIGFLHADSFSEGRSGFLSDMDHWGIETYFAIALTAAEYTPAIADHVFVWPNFVDPDVYRDYGLWKSIPVLFTGNQNSLYPWRRKITRTLTRYFPSLVCPHPGYTPERARSQVIVGERYARTINCSSFVPACGTVASEIIRKHFEVPACRSCLITERSAALEAAGFADMKNCVFADEADVVDKVAYLFAHPEELEAITTAGYELVHSRHTLRHRDQLRQWLELNRNLGADERIIQTSPFEPLKKVSRKAGAASSHVHSNGLLISSLREGDRNLKDAKYEVAEQRFLTCVNYYQYMPEPQLKLAICALYQGKADAALPWIMKPVQFTLEDYKAYDPDPVEWAVLIRTLLCLGKLDEARGRAGQFSWMRHAELDRIRWAVWALNGNDPAGLRLGTQPRRSIHEWPEAELAVWKRELAAMLQRCGQARFADMLKDATLPASSSASETGAPSQPGWQDNSAVNLGSSAGAIRAERRGFSRVATERLKEMLKPVLRGLEKRFGYFLPFHLSQARYDEFFGAVAAGARDERVKNILVIGVPIQDLTAAAVMAGANENRSRPRVFCLSTGQKQVGSEKVDWYAIPCTSPEDHGAQVTAILDRIRSEYLGFDLVVLDGAEHDLWPLDALRQVTESAQIICLHGINRPHEQRCYTGLLANSQFFLVDQNPGLRNGFAVFERNRTAEGTSVPRAGSRFAISPATPVGSR